MFVVLLVGALPRLHVNAKPIHDASMNSQLDDLAFVSIGSDERKAAPEARPSEEEEGARSVGSCGRARQRASSSCPRDGGVCGPTPSPAFFLFRGCRHDVTQWFALCKRHVSSSCEAEFGDASFTKYLR